MIDARAQECRSTFPEEGAQGAELVLATSLGDAKGGLAVAAAVGVAFSHGRPAVLLADLGAGGRRGPTMLAAATARELEDALRADGFEQVAARGRLCWLGLGTSQDALGELRRAVDALPERAVAVAHLPAELWQGALNGSVQRPSAALLRADLPRDRSLTAISVIELRARGIPVRVAARAPGRVASRRALAGLEAGGSASQRADRLARGLGTGRSEQRRSPAAPPGVLMAERGQALFMVIAAAFVILFCAAVLTALGGAVTGAGRTQRAADLAALSGAARSVTISRGCSRRSGCPAVRRTRSTWTRTSTWIAPPRPRERRRRETGWTRIGSASRSRTVSPSLPHGSRPP
jgi:hypothetical protein